MCPNAFLLQCKGLALDGRDANIRHTHAVHSGMFLLKGFIRLSFGPPSGFFQTTFDQKGRAIFILENIFYVEVSTTYRIHTNRMPLLIRMPGDTLWMHYGHFRLKIVKNYSIFRQKFVQNDHSGKCKNLKNR